MVEVGEMKTPLIPLLIASTMGGLDSIGNPPKQAVNDRKEREERYKAMQAARQGNGASKEAKARAKARRKKRGW